MIFIKTLILLCPYAPKCGFLFDTVAYHNPLKAHFLRCDNRKCKITKPVFAAFKKRYRVQEYPLCAEGALFFYYCLYFLSDSRVDDVV